MRPHLQNAEHSMAKWSKLEPLASAEPYYWRPYITFYRSQAKHICFHLANFSLRDIWIRILHLHSFAPPPPCACLNQLVPRTSKLLFFFCIKTLFWCLSEQIWVQNTIGVSRKLGLPETQLALNDLFTQRGPLTLNLFDSCASQRPSTPGPDPARFFQFDLKAPHVFDFFLIASCLLGQL